MKLKEKIINKTKYLGFSGGRLIDSFVFLPSFDLTWMKLYKDKRTYWTLRFSWFFWYISFGQIKKKLKEDGYY